MATKRKIINIQDVVSQRDKPPVKINTETSQATVPIRGIHERYGLIEIYKGCYVRIYRLGDNNYMTAPEEEQEVDYRGWRKLLNSFGTDCEFALTINNRSVNQQEFCDSVLIKEVGDNFDYLRKQMNTIILNRMNEGKNGIVKDKYLTVAAHAENVKKAYSVFQRMDKNIAKSMQGIGSNVQPVPLEEELDILYSIYNDGDDHLVQKSRVIDDNGHVSECKTFDYDNMRSMGLSINDLLAPSSITVEKKCIRLGSKFARVLKVTQLPSQLTDEFLTNVTDMNFNCITTMNYKPIPAKKAKAIVAKNLSFVRDEKQKALKAGQKAGVYDDSYVDPSVLEREAEALALRDAMHERDEKLFDTSLTVIVFAENEQKLNEYSESLITEYKKATVDLNVMTNQQEEGFNSTLPLCYNQIIETRTLTSSSSAIFIPFSTLEVNDDNGINYSCNLISKNLIVYDRMSASNFNGFVLGTPGCVDRETEFFNGTEWKSIADYKDGEQVLQFNPDTEEASLVVPERYIKKKCDKMYHFETAWGLDQTLSPEHRVLYRTYLHRSKTYSKMKEISAEELYQQMKVRPFHGRIQTAFQYDGSGIDLTDAEIKVMLAVICDGTFDKRYPLNNYCTICLKKERKITELRKILTEWGEPFEESNVGNGHTIFYFKAPRHEKQFLPYWYECNHHQLQVVCDNILNWDGCVTRGKSFSTTIKETADFVQFAFSACGYRATVSYADHRGETSTVKDKKYTRHSGMYTVNIAHSFMTGLVYKDSKGNNQIEMTEVKPSDGYKYCFTVPTHALVLRRNGRIFITGNSGKSFTSKVSCIAA